MSTFSAPPLLSTRNASSGSDIVRGLLLGLLPVVLLAILVAVTLVLTAFMRQQVSPSGFFAQQQAEVITLIAGLAVALLIYSVALVLIFRRVKIWQRVGARMRANAALWMLALSALIVLLPVILAVVLPQYAAP